MPSTILDHLLAAVSAAARTYRAAATDAAAAHPAHVLSARQQTRRTRSHHHFLPLLRGACSKIFSPWLAGAVDADGCDSKSREYCGDESYNNIIACAWER
jgi:hypothetical protein